MTSYTAEIRSNCTVTKVISKGQNLALKCYQPLDLLIEERFRSSHTSNIGSFSKRASKLLAVKVGGLKKSLPPSIGLSRASRPRFDSDLV